MISAILKLQIRLWSNAYKDAYSVHLLGEYELPIQNHIRELIVKVKEIDKELNRLLNIREELIRLLKIHGLSITEQLSTVESNVSSDLRDLIYERIKKHYHARIAYLGPEGSFTHEVVMSLFQGEYISCNSISQVFKLVSSESVNYGVVPLENSLEGIVNETIDNFFEYHDVNIVQCVEMRVKLCLACSSDVEKVEDIEKIYTHPHAYAQARNYLTRFKNIDVILTSSTAKALEHVKKTSKACAIASKRGALMRGLKVIEENVEDKPSYTRFVILSKKSSRTGNKTSIIFTVENRPGSLYNALEPFSRNRINLSMIYSRPTRTKPWEYYFYMDLEANLEDVACVKAINEFKSRVSFMRILGSYSIIKLET